MEKRRLKGCRMVMGLLLAAGVAAGVCLAGCIVIAAPRVEIRELGDRTLIIRQLDSLADGSSAELTATGFDDEQNRGLIMLTMKMRDSEGGEVSFPKCIAEQDQVGVISLTRQYQPEECFVKRLKTGFFGDIATQEHGVRVYFKGKSVDPEHLDLKILFVIRCFTQADDRNWVDDLLVVEREFPRLKLGETVTLKMEAEPPLE